MPTRALICRSPAVSVGGLEGSAAVAPRLLLGFALSNGPKPWGAERGAEQQSMATRVRPDAHRRRGRRVRRGHQRDHRVGPTKRESMRPLWALRPKVTRVRPWCWEATLASTRRRYHPGLHRSRRVKGRMPGPWPDGRPGSVGETRRRAHPRLRRDGRLARSPNLQECDLSTPAGRVADHRVDYHQSQRRRRSHRGSLRGFAADRDR